MVKVEHITKDWKEAGSFAAQVNLYGFWDEHTFLTKSGDLGAALRIGGIDYESLDHAGRDYVVKRLEAAFRSIDDRCRLYQILFKHNRPVMPHATYENPLVRAAVEQRSAFLESKADRLYSIEIYWVVMVDGSYARTGLLHALAQLPKQPRSSLRDLHALFSGSKERTLLYEQIERDRLRLQQKINSLSGQLNDLMTVELSGAEGTFRILRRLVNLRPSKINNAPLCDARHLDWQVCDSELEAHRGYLRLDDDCVRVLTLKELPSETRPLILNRLLDIPANFHVVTEWHPVDNAKARKEIASRRRHHHNSKTSFVSNLQDRQNAGNQDNLVDDSKEAAVAELGGALTALGMEGKNFGEFTLSVVVYDEDRMKVEHAVAEFQKLFTQHDGLLYEERYNLLNVFFATVPGNKQFNLRKQWALNSNYADLSFLFTVDSGNQWNPHLEREYLAVLESTHGTPYFLNMHCGDVAHALMLGATGSGKTKAVVLPAMRQLFAFRASDPEQRLSGVVLEVKGDLCRQVRAILNGCGRTEDYVEVSLTGDIRYNPLNNDSDAYAQAFNIASVITAIWGKGKEPFWQQSYTDLVRYVIMLHRVRYGYVTMLDIFRTVISSGTLEAMLTQTGRRFIAVSFVGVSKADYLKYESLLAPFSFAWSGKLDQYIARWTEESENALVRQTSIAASLYRRRLGDPETQDSWQSIHYWYWEHWKFFRSEVKTSIIQGIAVFLSLFETNAQVRRVFCPPKELYEGKPCASDPHGVVLPTFDELIESGKIVGLNFPTALNPALSKIIGTMMKVDYQRAVLLRIPVMEDEPERHFRPTVFICDEYQNFATVGGDNPTGDDRFLSLSRQPKCIPIVATQSISSLKEALPNEGVKTLLQAFRTKVFLSTSDPDTARYASELCGKADKTRISYTVSESSSNANVGWLSGRTSSNKGSVSASKQYQKQKEPLFEENVFFDLKNAQSVVVAFDGISPLPPTYCYLKPDFLPIDMTWFDQEKIAFNSRRVSR